MAQDDVERTEDATPKRRQDAREKGEVAQSREVTSVIGLAAVFLAALSALGGGLALAVATQARASWSGVVIVPTTLADYHAVWMVHAGVVARAVLPFLLLLMLAGVVGNVVQSGLLFTPKPLQPQLSRISLVKGFKRMFGPDRLFDLLKAFVKIGVAVAATWIVLGPALERIMALSQADTFDALALAAALVRRLTILMLIGFGAFAILDLFYMRWRFEKKLRMTKQEVRDEVKQREGDPKLKARVRSMAQELSRMRMIAEVGRADVVVTNPTHYAVALVYVRETMAAPKVVAKGRNHLALRIRRAAREAGVPVVENPPLAQLLYKTAPLGREVPETLYRAVAEVLAYITRLDPSRARDWKEAS